LTAPDAVVGHHMNPYASGVSRFNEMLARRLGIPFVGLMDPRADEAARPLLSFKVGELDAVEAERLAGMLSRRDGVHVQAFLHAYDGSPLEERLVREASVVYAGNAEIEACVSSFTDRVTTVWAPGLIVDRRQFKPATLTVFSFGMAHKVRVDMFSRLRDLLEATGATYAVYMSNAHHATATLREAEEVHAQMRAVFSHDFFFMGNLSDVGISNHLRTSTFFAAFFRRGARANNTSLLSAMEHGAVVITNLDEHSPAAFQHMDNVIDIGRCEALPSDPLTLARLRVRAMETAQDLSWDRLVSVVRGERVCA
jgi:hypothetical protein